MADRQWWWRPVQDPSGWQGPFSGRQGAKDAAKLAGLRSYEYRLTASKEVARG